MQRRHLITALGLGALAARSFPAHAQSDWAAIETAAAAEGEVMLYHTFSPTGTPQIVAAFNRDYPAIRVTEARLPSAQFYQRFAAECGAGQPQADVCANAMDDTLLHWRDNGWIADWQPPEAAGIPTRFVTGNSFWGVQVVRQMIAWNNARVRAAEAPRDWEDLFDPKWKGRIGVDPPWRSVGPMQAIALLEKRIGITDVAERFKRQDVRFFEGSAGLLQAVIRNDISVALMADIPLNAALEDGVPVGVTYPSGGVVFVSIAAFVARQAPHPNAGRVMANWLMSRRGQIALQDLSGAPSVREDIPPPRHLPANGALRLVDGRTLVAADDQARIVGEWRRVFGLT
jgi:iron(III) transport system substrate-binding protein